LNNKIVPTKRISAIFLAIVLMVGTITAIFPSFIITGPAQAQLYYGMDSYNDRKSYGMDKDRKFYGEDSYGHEYPDNNFYNSYESDYRMDNYRKSYETNSYEPTTSYGMDDNNYQKTYGNDNGFYESQYQPSYKPDYKPKYPSYDGKDNRDKSKDSKSVDINKFNCINTNININGNNTGDISLGNKGQGYLGVSSSSDGYGGEGYSKQGKGFTCIINNNNNNTNISDGGGNQTVPGNQTIPPEPTTGNLTVTKTLACDLGPIICDSPANDPFITVTGNNPIPSSFRGSDTPVVVSLGPGSYDVDESLFNEGLQDCTSRGFQGGIQGLAIGTLICTNFSPDCSGDISAGEELSCDIANTFINTTNTAIDTNSAEQIGRLSITEDSSALEKITKLKQQWLELLP
jgi:hypothetical protein